MPWIFFVVQQTPPLSLGHCLLIHEVPWSLSDTPQSVGLLWTSDQVVAETSTWQYTTLTTDRHPWLLVGFEPVIPASERPQTHALGRAATGSGCLGILLNYSLRIWNRYDYLTWQRACHLLTDDPVSVKSLNRWRQIWDGHLDKYLNYNYVIYYIYVYYIIYIINIWIYSDKLQS